MSDSSEPAATVASPSSPAERARPAGFGDGLSEQEVARRLTEASGRRGPGTSRSYASIVRANVLTVFNLILAGFGVVTLVFGDARDALFLGSSSPTRRSGSARRFAPSARSTASRCWWHREPLSDARDPAGRYPSRTSCPTIWCYSSQGIS